MKSPSTSVDHGENIEMCDVVHHEHMWYMWYTPSNFVLCLNYNTDSSVLFPHSH